MVHQHFMLVPVFTVAENVMLGHEQTRGARRAQPRAPPARRCGSCPTATGCASTRTPSIEDIPVGVQQRVEIIKALASHAKILILDEPTAVLTPQEIDELMGIMRELKAQGTSIIFITHKLREVKAIGDRISVIRRGKVVGTAAAVRQRGRAGRDDGRAQRLARGRQGRGRAPARRCCTAEGISVIDPRGHMVVKDVSFEARAGEVLGIAGVQGNGQTELIKSLLGLIRPDAGRIELDGKDISKHGPRQSLEDGIGYIPEDRSHDGYVGTFSVAREPGARPLPVRRVLRRAGAQARHDRRERRRRGSRSSTSAPSRPRRRSRPCRAATSRRWSSPASSRGRSRC